MYNQFDIEENKENNNNVTINKFDIKDGDKPVFPYYEDYLDPEQRQTKLPYIIRLWRNRCIIALILQTIASLTGMVMYSLRRIRVGQIVNVICLLLIIFFGRGGVLTLNKMHVAIHGVLTSSVFGVIFVYSLLEILFIRDIEEESSEQFMLFIFCVPYLIDFMTGLCMLQLSNILFEYEKQEVKMEIPQINLRDNELCVICATKKINTVFYTCGHKAACYECSILIKKSYKMECPLCRKEIKDLIVIYEQ